MRKLTSRALAITLVGILSVPAVADAVPGFVNDNNVRMREKPALSGKVLATYNKGTALTTLGSTSSSEGDLNDFDWIKVSIGKLTGWIYGEFISYTSRSQEIEPYRVSNFREGSIRKKSGAMEIFIGMKSTMVTRLLGKPTSDLYDEQDNNETWEYKEQPGLKILINRGIGRIVHLILTGPEWQLGSGIGVGDEVEKVMKATPTGTVSGSMFYVDLDVGNHAGFYQAGVVVNFNAESKRITSIQIGTPE